MIATDPETTPGTAVMGATTPGAVVITHETVVMSHATAAAAGPEMDVAAAGASPSLGGTDPAMAGTMDEMIVLAPAAVTTGTIVTVDPVPEA